MSLLTQGGGEAPADAVSAHGSFAVNHFIERIVRVCLPRELLNLIRAGGYYHLLRRHRRPIRLQ
jgi:hypothetical protein